MPQALTQVGGGIDSGGLEGTVKTNGCVCHPTQGFPPQGFLSSPKASGASDETADGSPPA